MIADFDYTVLVAIDFDGTLTNKDNSLNKKAIRYVRKIQKLEVDTILYTCRQGEKLKEAINILKEQNICFDFINKDNGKRNSGIKPNADIYIDDKANTQKIYWFLIYMKIKKIIRRRKNVLHKKNIRDCRFSQTKFRL